MASKVKHPENCCRFFLVEFRIIDLDTREEKTNNLVTIFLLYSSWFPAESTLPQAPSNLFDDWPQVPGQYLRQSIREIKDAPENADLIVIPDCLHEWVDYQQYLS